MSQVKLAPTNLVLVINIDYNCYVLLFQEDYEDYVERMYPNWKQKVMAQSVSKLVVKIQTKPCSTWCGDLHYTYRLCSVYFDYGEERVVLVDSHATSVQDLFTHVYNHITSNTGLLSQTEVFLVGWQDSEEWTIHPTMLLVARFLMKLQQTRHNFVVEIRIF